MFKGMILDLDGTVYRGSSAVTGAPEFINRMIENNMRYIFVTNRSNRTPDVVRDQLQSYGIPCRLDNILTSGQVTAGFLKKGSVYFIGEEGLEEALKQAEFTITEESPEYVIVGWDRAINYEKIEKACRFIRAGATFVGTNPDRVVNTDKGLSPGNGAILSALATASGVEPVVIGKPEKPIMDIALERLSLTHEETILVGDNLETDIKAGINAGIRTALILTGVSGRDDVERTQVFPNWIVENFKELERMVFEG